MPHCFLVLCVCVLFSWEVFFVCFNFSVVLLGKPYRLLLGQSFLCHGGRPRALIAGPGRSGPRSMGRGIVTMAVTSSALVSWLPLFCWATQPSVWIKFSRRPMYKISRRDLSWLNGGRSQEPALWSHPMPVLQGASPGTQLEIPRLESSPSRLCPGRRPSIPLTPDTTTEGAVLSHAQLGAWPRALIQSQAQERWSRHDSCLQVQPNPMREATMTTTSWLIKDRMEPT